MREKRKTKIGVVVSNKMQKTVVVNVKTSTRHPRYHKIIRKITRYKAHDESSCQIGDLVKLEETRPLSKDKCWKVIEKVSQTNLPKTKPVESELGQQQ